MPSSFVLDEYTISLAADMYQVTDLYVNPPYELTLVLECVSTRFGPEPNYDATPTTLLVEGIPLQVFRVGDVALVGGTQRTDPNMIDLGSDLAQLTSITMNGTTATIVGQLKPRRYNLDPRRFYCPGVAPHFHQLYPSIDLVNDVAGRFHMLWIERIRDTNARLNIISEDLLMDTATRFNLMSADIVEDTASRFDLAIVQDTASRFGVMSEDLLGDIAGDFILVAP